mmetsp:Transcript_18287/g.49156  ORF Transcript_18287/g.49156 Transcript_18287/m.49156 type:complete len:243 (+) Transcript_18287:157-885(+)
MGPHAALKFDGQLRGHPRRHAQEQADTWQDLSLISHRQSASLNLPQIASKPDARRHLHGTRQAFAMRVQALQAFIKRIPKHRAASEDGRAQNPVIVQTLCPRRISNALHRLLQRHSRWFVEHQSEDVVLRNSIEQNSRLVKDRYRHARDRVRQQHVAHRQLHPCRQGTRRTIALWGWNLTIVSDAGDLQIGVRVLPSETDGLLGQCCRSFQANSKRSRLACVGQSQLSRTAEVRPRCARCCA